MQEIIVSRTDAIGDVVLTLPLCGMLKKYFPNTKLTFLGQSYTEPVLRSCEHIDEFIDVKNLESYKPNADAIIHVFPQKHILQWAYKYRIPIRIATYSRWYAWLYANKLVRLNRKNSNLHEAQLNLKLLKPFHLPTEYSLNELIPFYGLTRIPQLPAFLHPLLSQNKANWIIHPTSHGSARTWELSKFYELIVHLPSEKYNVFVTGTTKDQEQLTGWIEKLPKHVHNLVGKLSLNDFISLIDKVDGLVAGSTGPLHIAAALGKKAIGIYPSIRPMHPERWKPIGLNATCISIPKNCKECKNTPSQCACLQSIPYTTVLNKIIQF